MMAKTAIIIIKVLSFLLMNFFLVSRQVCSDLVRHGL